MSHIHVHGCKDGRSVPSATVWVAAEGGLLRHHHWHGGASFASTSSFLSICKSDSAALLTINCMIGASFSLQLETTSAAGEDMEVENVTLDDRAFSSAPDMTLGLESSSTADVPVRKLLV